MGFARTTDIEIEQELSRPYVYASLKWKPSGFDVISVKDPGKARIIYRWRIEDPGIHEGWGADDGKYFELNGRYYYVQAVAFRRSGPDHDLGAIVFDVTGLPDTTTIREVGRIRTPDTPGGFHNVFMYKHSDRRALLFATVRAPPTAPHGANIYDMGGLPVRRTESRVGWSCAVARAAGRRGWLPRHVRWLRPVDASGQVLRWRP